MRGGELSLGATRQVLGVVTLDGGTVSGGTLDSGSYLVRSGLATGVLSGVGGLKEGEGMARLTGVNTFGGAVQVNAGVLRLDGVGQTVASSAI